MRMSAFVITAVLAAGLPGVASAQGSAPPAAVPAAAPPTLVGTTQSHWIVSGFVGSNFGSSTSDPSFDFGGQAAWLWKGVVGAEALADFAPKFKLNDAGLVDHPKANSYMLNAIFALPVGGEGQFQPYVSGGAGGMQLKTQVFDLFLPHASGTFPTTTSNGDEMRWGSNIGGGVMGFAGTIGFRADVRWYKASANSTLNTSSAVASYTDNLLKDLDYWRANIGVALRW